MKKSVLLMICFCLVYALSYAQDEAMNESEFDFKVAASSLETLQGSLKAFGDITDVVFTDSVLDKIYSSQGQVILEINPQVFTKIERDEMSWRKQNLINPNNLLRIKGTLLKMEMEINYLNYRNDMLKKNSNSLEAVRHREQEYIESKEAFEDFIKTHYWYE